MSRRRALKIVMILVGLFFVAGICPLIMLLWFRPDANDNVPMFLSLYVTLGVFMLIAARNPAEHQFPFSRRQAGSRIQQSTRSACTILRSCGTCATTSLNAWAVQRRILSVTGQ